MRARLPITRAAACDHPVCFCRLRKTDNLRVARACGARIVHRVEEITEGCVGKDAGLYEVKKIGDEYHSFIVDCKDPKACSIILRGGSKDVLNEIERNLHDAMNVARNVYREPKICPGTWIWLSSLSGSSQFAGLCTHAVNIARVPWGWCMAMQLDSVPACLRA